MAPLNWKNGCKKGVCELDAVYSNMHINRICPKSDTLQIMSAMKVISRHRLHSLKVTATAKESYRNGLETNTKRKQGYKNFTIT